jgi:hypothetical protein
MLGEMKSLTSTTIFPSRPRVPVQRRLALRILNLPATGRERACLVEALTNARDGNLGQLKQLSDGARLGERDLISNHQRLEELLDRLLRVESDRVIRNPLVLHELLSDRKVFRGPPKPILHEIPGDLFRTSHRSGTRHELRDRPDRPRRLSSLRIRAFPLSMAQ